MNTARTPASPTDRRPVGIGRVAGLVAYALTPFISLGYGSWLAFLVAAIRYSYLGRRVALLLWSSTGLLLAAAAGMVATADAAGGTGDRVFAGCLLVAFVGGGVEAVVLAIIAGVRGYQGRTPRPLRDHASGDLADAVSQASPQATGRSAPETVTAARHRRWWWILGLCLLGLMTAMSLALHQFNDATSCAVANPSDPCIRSLDGTITAPGRSEDIPGVNGTTTTRYHLIIALRDSGQRLDVWTFRPRPDLRLGDAVTLEQWRGHYITVAGHGLRVGLNGWEPRILTWMLVIFYASTLIAALLWWAGLLGFDPHPRGRRSTLRSIVGWALVMDAIALTCITIPMVLSAPQLYLRWW